MTLFRTKGIWCPACWGTRRQAGTVTDEGIIVAAAMSFSSVSVIGNALRLRRVRV